MTEPKVIRSEINRKLTTIACERESRMAKLRKPLITVKYKRNRLYGPMVKMVHTLASSTSAARLFDSSSNRATKNNK